MVKPTSTAVAEMNHSLKQIAKALQAIAIALSRDYDQRAELKASSPSR